MFAHARRRRRSVRAQMPSRFLRRSLTACGLALPPDAFITWPTNQPIAFGFVLASPTLSGILGDDLVDELFDAPKRRSPASGRALRRSRADRRPRSRRSRTRPWRSCRRSCRRRSDREWRRAALAVTGDAAMSLPSLVEPAGEFVDHPIGGELRVAVCARPLADHGFEIFRGLALGDEHAGVVAGKRVARA